MLDDLILLRLLARDDAPRSKVRADVAPFSARAVHGQQFAGAVERLVAAGRVRVAGPHRGRLQLTDAGRAHTRDVFRVPPGAVPSPHRAWSSWRDLYAVPRALDVGRLPDADAVRAAMLRRFYLRELSARLPLASLRATVDLLLAKRLGAAGSRGADVRQAALRAWVNEEPPGGAPGSGKNLSAHLPEDLPEFADAVRTAARQCTDGRFGGNKVFISQVWSTLLAAGRVRPDGARTFKETLVRANTAGLLRLSRADLAGAHDARHVRESETPYLGETFHFLRLD